MIFPQQQQYPLNFLLRHRTTSYHSTYTASSSSSISSFRTMATFTLPPRTDLARNAAAPNEYNNSVRLSKLIAICVGISRKDAERHIKDGNVTLYGKVVTSSAMMISYPEISKPNNIAALTLQRKAVPVLQYDSHHVTGATTTASSSTSPPRPNQVRVWLVHKMAGELVTDIDPYRRPTVLSRIHTLGKYNKTTKRHEHIKMVGRLDMNTEGLLIATNCGLYARQLEFSKHMLHRVYRVRVHGRPLVSYQINRIQNGQVVIDSIQYPPMKIAYDTKSRKNTSATNQWMTITCTQGKNRQIRKVLEHFHCTVTRLIRISYGDYNLGTIPKGMVQEVTNDDGGIIPYHQHVRRGKLLSRATSKSRPNEPSSSTAAASRGRSTRTNDPKRVLTQSNTTTTATNTSNTRTGRHKIPPPTTTSLPPPHRPVQWIRM
jgi:pseudouridine synthase